ncbi:MAG: glycine cleavage system protein GcvH [Eubacteriales bacterium]|jgi:glycine cleavage system H protein|nr:glycine cleavage system protein GcvH [Eubacteriales bacterium]MDD4104942.1 glycine cleavage system protein GcvH [Eubacteriales bacterium]MDD4710453.1 glycine cleavage system protein GcvH [Eubacteriales bacterium]NLO16440.1 glycine cleavage system protein GcvH [Clostridiales bacterium]
MNNPESLMYTKSHEWLHRDGDTYEIGITDYAQSELGDIVFINLPNVDDEVVSGEALADVESVKAVSDILSPVSGTVVEVNEELLDAPEKINEAPYHAWIARISSVTDVLETLTSAQYEEFLKQEE